MKRIELYENKIHMLWEVTDAGRSNSCIFPHCLLRRTH